MKIVYRARDIIEANIVSGMLESHGIETHVGGYYLQGGIGELAAQDFATVYVDDENIETARALVSNYEASGKENRDF